MNLYEMIISNIEPIRLKTGYYARKRLLHSGYELYAKTNYKEFVHMGYTQELR